MPRLGERGGGSRICIPEMKEPGCPACSLSFITLYDDWEQVMKGELLRPVGALK